MRIDRQTITTAAAAFLFAGFVVSGSFTTFKNQPIPPHSDLMMSVRTPVVAKGEPLVVHVSGRRNKLCVVYLARSFKDLSTGYVIHRESVPGGFNDLGEFSDDVQMKLPPDMPPGEYQLRVLQNNDCGEEVYPIFFPPVTFRLVSQR